MNYVVIAILLAVLGYDIKLALTTKDTISKKYQRLFPTAIDIIFLVITLALVCATHLDPTIKAVIAAACGHVFWPNKETYVKR